MTGLGKYQKGVELEAQGLTALQIAERLNYKNVQAWHAAKSYYSKKQAAFVARAKGEPAVMPDPLPVEAKKELPVEEVTPAKQVRAPRLKQKPQFAPAKLPEPPQAPVPALAALKQASVNYRGKVGRYDVGDQWVTIYLPFEVRGSSADLVFEIGIERARELSEEFRDLLTVLEVTK